jgi:hypothetical protein
VTLHRRKGDRVRGPVPGWKPRGARQEGVYADLMLVLEKHRRDGTLPRGPRGLFYDLRPYGKGNGVTYRKATGKTMARDMVANPQVVQECLAMMRRAGIVKEWMISDSRAPSPLTPYLVEADDEPEDLARHAARTLDDPDLDERIPQRVVVEGWCEAEGLGPRIANIAWDPWQVSVYPSGGFEGIKPKQVTAQRIVDRGVLTGLSTVVFHIGDGDTPGKNLYRAGAQDIAMWACALHNDTFVERPPWDAHDDDSRTPTVVIRDAEGIEWLRIVRLAVTDEQIAAGDVEVDEEGKAEAEQIEPLKLTEIVTDFLEEWLDRPVEDAAADEAREARKAVISTEAWQLAVQTRLAALRPRDPGELSDFEQALLDAFPDDDDDDDNND